MTTGIADRRKQFVKDTFPHLDSLWQSALWFTLRSSLAEELVLKTMARGYREWPDSDSSVNRKAWLFRILTRELLGSGNRKQQLYQSTPIHSENAGASADYDGENPQNTTTAIKHSQLPLLAGISDVAVKEAVARLKPHSRLMLTLLYREQFSYAEIAYINDLAEDSMKVILTKLRRLIPGYVLETADRSQKTSDGQPVVGTNSCEFELDRENISLGLPSIWNREYPINAAAERWENEGGAVAIQSWR